jgi:signal transduction histidine kinase/CheY-like chemotaxis protein
MSVFTAKRRPGYFFWILSLALALMLLILAAQLFTDRNIDGLKNGNKEAAVNFTINNSLQEIVNISFALEARLVQQDVAIGKLAAIKDSLTIIGYNTSVLEKLRMDTATQKLFHDLDYYINQQVVVGYMAVDAIEKGNRPLKKQLTDSLIRLNLSDSIYNTATAIGKQLEKKLQTTLNNNTETSARLSAFNKALALIAIIAILLLGTIIINRHLRQLQLIKDLENANAEVRKAASVKEQFLANMIHEIRTPLNAIKGFSSLMQQTPLSKEQKQYTDIVENASSNLMQLVNDILDISKIGAGKMVVEKKVFNLSGALQEVEMMFMNVAKEKEITFSCIISEEVPFVLNGDEDRLQQVLINLVSNAIKFTQRGFVQVTVGTISETEDMTWLSFCVEDTGVGIAEGNKDLIFERFQQVSENKGALQKGTGLGLAIVKELCMLMGGNIAVQSRRNEGSVFTVTLPFDKVSVKEETIGIDKFDSTALTAFPSTSILVAEDNKVNQLLIKKLLQQFGITAVVTENGVETMDVLAKQNFDLLLLDIQMPLMDGYETIARLRSKEITMPVIAMTAYVMPGEKEKCIEAGMNDYIAKPIEPQELYHTLAKYLLPQQNPAAAAGILPNSFLLNIAGGDRKMAMLIMNEVINQLPDEIKALQKIIDQKNITNLSVLCHHLVSTISPLGNDTESIKKIEIVQLAITENKEAAAILELVNELKMLLDKLNNALNTK